jgi:hypothetical protein
MTENRKRVTVKVTGQQRTVTIRSPAQGGQATVNVEVLPVRVISPDEYKGDYTATPEFEAQTFETKDKLMTDDFTVESIPVYDTTNPAGGITIYIGGNFNG